MKLFASLVEAYLPPLAFLLALQETRRMELALEIPQTPPQVQQMTVAFEAMALYLLPPVSYLELAGTLRAQSIALVAANLEFAALGLAYLYCTMSRFDSYTHSYHIKNDLT